MANDQRVAVTGMAINTPLGDDLGRFLNALLEGRSAVTRWKGIDDSRIYSKVGADLSDYDTAAKLAAQQALVPPDLWRRLRKLHASLPWTTRISTLMAVDAFRNAQLFGDPELDLRRVGVIVAGHNINYNYDYQNRTQFDSEPDYIDSLFALQSLDTDHAGSVSETLGARGPIYTMGAACASGNAALRAAVDEVRYHDCEAVVVVGAVLDWSPFLLHAMGLLGAISINGFHDEPHRASRPYDTRREGFVPAHGGAAVIVERLERARRRGAPVYGEILAVEASSDANHTPAPNAGGQAELIRRTLDKASVRPEQIDYVSAHATSTPLGDVSEIRALKQAFGEHAGRLKINAPKSLLGHTCWAAPVVELVAALLQVKAGRLHPSINIDELDPEVDLDVCANQGASCRVEYMMNNSFGFGGINCISVIRNLAVAS